MNNRIRWLFFGVVSAGNAIAWRLKIAEPNGAANFRAIPGPSRVQTEWWYFTSNLWRPDVVSGVRELTFFNAGIRPCRLTAILHRAS
jgi:hypothetical protein